MMTWVLEGEEMGQCPNCSHCGSLGNFWYVCEDSDEAERYYEEMTDEDAELE